MIDLQIELFLLLLVGYFLGKRGFLNENTRAQLTDIVVYIILPCSIIKSFEMDLSAEVLRSTFQVLLAALGIQILYWILNHILYRGFPEEEQTACKYSTMVTNASFIGMPIASALYGSEGLLYASIFVLPQRIFMWAYGLPMYTQVQKKDIVKKVLLHPCVFSIFMGIVLMVLYSNGIYLPTALSKTLGALGGCTTALCLLVIGGVLSELKPEEMISVRSVIFSLFRLILIPLLLIGILKFTPLSPVGSRICVLLSAMPAPTTTVILAQKYNKNPKFASKLLVTSTLISLVSIPVVIGIMDYI